ncbi:MAG: helix-turn-helix transcriptional regulator [Erysipelotrichaceae bacterium]|nr:helix-turn-helix transcriptional regulator [Erysipelotrichaceae bacterium]
MMYAYDEIYLNDAMRNLGEAFDYSATVLSISMDDFLDMFIISGIAEQFADGVPKFVSGLSGTELVWEVLSRVNRNVDFPSPQTEYNYSPEYWCGWILAFYQWNTKKSFKEIKKYLPMSEIYKLYPTLHEASEEKFIDVANSILERKNLPTKLQTVRKAIGLTQKELSEKSGVTLRMIQQYEQRAKDINKATACNLFALAQVLGCKAEDLLE